MATQTSEIGLPPLADEDRQWLISLLIERSRRVGDINDIKHTRRVLAAFGINTPPDDYEQRYEKSHR